MMKVNPLHRSYRNRGTVFQRCRGKYQRDFPVSDDEITQAFQVLEKFAAIGDFQTCKNDGALF